MRGVSKNPINKSCIQCFAGYIAAHHTQKYCCVSCKRKAYQSNGGKESTKRQYELISGNWVKYFARLCNMSFRKGFLTKQDCLDLLEKQNYLCALTGVEMTCNLIKGTVCKTNASIDRIDPKGLYTKDNIQLVCVAVNKLRVDMSLPEFINWCKKVANHAVCK
jgi:hypothetical protein